MSLPADTVPHRFTTRRQMIVLGPPATGKSTLSRALAESLRAERSVALVEMDALAAMLGPVVTEWSPVQRLWAATAAAWLGEDVDVVVAEGGSTPEEARQVAAAAPSGTTVHVVAVTCRFEDALSRARQDPTRGISRDEGFLRDAHRAFARVLPDLGADLVLDTSAQDVDGAVERIAALLGSAVPGTGRPTQRPDR